MILLVAPFDAKNPEFSNFIAASKKIHLIIQILSKIDDNIVLLNSSHWSNTTSKIRFERKITYLNCHIQVVTPRIYRNKFIGKFLNLYSIKYIYSNIIKKYGIPKAIWLYNGYAFESKFASYAKKCLKNNTKIILEFEDWHFARSRGLNPKPYIDWFYWKLLLNHLDFCITVNKYLYDKCIKYVKNGFLLPGLFDNKVIENISNNIIFNNPIITVGYFGGLSKEKGAEFLLNLIKEKYNIQVKFIICGNGDFQSTFEDFSNKNPTILDFYTQLNETELIKLYNNIDIFLNPHIECTGVFPFKVIEAIAMRKLLISSKLNLNGLEWLNSAIEFQELNVSVFKETIENSHKIYQNKKENIISISNIINNNYSTDAFYYNIKNNIFLN
jgi:hypothetical protein